MRNAITIAACLALVACGGPAREETTTTDSTTTLESSGGQTSGGEPVASSEPTDTHAASRVGTHATVTTRGEAPDVSGPTTDLQEYLARIMRLIRHHWTVPGTLSPEVSAGLSSSVSISIDETTRRATGYRIVSESGNTIFDESVRHGMQALVDAAPVMPDPPPGLDDRTSVRLRLSGR